MAVDWLAGPEFNLQRTAVFQELKGWLLSNLVWGVFAGTPCETFSRARRAPAGSAFPGPLRSSSQPRGLTKLSGSDRRKVAAANLVSDRAAVLLRIAAERGLVCGEENPASSILWLTKQRQKQTTSGPHIDYVIDHCAFGTSYRARTRFRLAFCREAPELAKSHCTGRGICSFSKKPHAWLSGADSSGFRTKIKAAYPTALCNILAKVFIDGMLNMYGAVKWQLLSKG